MQVLFVKDLKSQGKKGEIKEVKDGYAQNFLIKNGYAKKLTESTLNEYKKEKETEKKEGDRLTAEATKLKEKMDKIEIAFKVKVGANDKVFGSISPKQIKEQLEVLGYKIDKKDIVCDSALATLGYHNIKIMLYKDISAKIKVKLEK